MRPIPARHKEIINSDPYYEVCARMNEECEGRMTIEHAFTYAGRQISEMWNYVPLCWYHHLGLGLNKRKNREIAVSRATSKELSKYPNLNWKEYEHRSD